MSGLKASLYNGTFNLPDDTFLSNTNQKFPYLVTGDDGFFLGYHVMKPYAGKFLIHAKRIFNYRLSRARRVSEKTLCVATARWCTFK